jgi:hypothetical protein
VPAVYDGGVTIDFTVVLRGYERTQVEAVIGPATAALAHGGAAQRAAAREALRSARFEVSLRGYDRFQVDGEVKRLLQGLDGLGEADDLRTTLGSVLRIDQPTDQAIVDEVRRLRELADRHHL